MSTSRGTSTLVVALLLAVTSTACRDAVRAVTAPEGPQPAPAQHDIAPIGDPSDSWEWMSATVPTYVEMVALDQTPHADDGVARVCPDDQLIMRNANLQMEHNGETINFYFRGPFTFLRRVSTTSPYPTALYRFNKDTYSDDRKYYAPAGNGVLLACDGHYVLNNDLIRLWVGHFYGKLYNGPILPNPSAHDPLACSSGGGGGGGSGYGPLWPNWPVDYGPSYNTSVDNYYYDPYAPDGGDAVDCSGLDGDGGISVGGGGGTSGDPGGGGSNCSTEWVAIEVSYDGGETWSVWWEGEAQVCG